MTSYQRGNTGTLLVQWRTSADGPAVDVTDLELTVSLVSDQTVVVGPTSVGIVHQATGLYSYNWDIPADTAIGDYLVLWTATDPDDDQVEASEVISITSALEPGSGPCGWEVDPEELGVCDAWADVPEERRETALTLASSFLWAATGRRFGVCPVTIRPNQPRGTEVLYRSFPVVPGLSGMGSSGPFLFSGRWFNAGCATACCGDSACAIVLRGPVASVDEVMVGEDVIPASSYRVDVSGGAYLLVRIDGECWPVCQTVAAEPGEAGAFVVTYGYGLALPLALQVAAALLACEYASALAGGPCKLPAKMTRLSRQGVEVELEPPAPDDGKTGIREVDDVIASLNPGRRASPPLIMSPDLPEGCDRMTVVPAGS